MEEREIKVRSIFSKYSENIVESINLPDPNKKDIILVPDIKDLINLSIISKEPVLYYEKKK